MQSMQRKLKQDTPEARAWKQSTRVVPRPMGEAVAGFIPKEVQQLRDEVAACLDPVFPLE